MAKDDKALEGIPEDKTQTAQAADVTVEQFTELQKMLAESAKMMKQQQELIQQSNEQNKQLSEQNKQFTERLAKLESNQPNTAIGKKPKFVPAKKSETKVGNVKVRFRKVFADRGEVIIPTEKDGLAVIRTRIDDVIDDKEVMTYLYESEKANLAKGKAIGYLELVD